MGAPKPTPGRERLEGLRSLTIDDFCFVENICRSSFYNLKRRGKAPRLTYAGKKVNITPEDHEEWRAAQKQDPEPVGAE